ncbi:hypothetical protein YTPLAS18_06510 [Nitrospira sp.]|nr:hypothetical protein YTPLAS18_06510 [Nitrospira sp.]
MNALTKQRPVGHNALMSEATPKPSPASTQPDGPLPDRTCTWCKVPMNKRLVASGLFLHYTCPKCVFQHTITWKTDPASPNKSGKAH